RTPVLENALLNAGGGAQLHFKCENLQEMGAFKARGASNAIFARSAAELRAGVVTHSSGNHGAAVARAARLRGVPAHVVMPQNCSAAKLAAVRAYGGQVTLCAPTLAAREAAAAQTVADTGAVFIHPYDDPDVIAGQGTIALELLEQVPQLDWLLCPVGGGGLASGIAGRAKRPRPSIRGNPGGPGPGEAGGGKSPGPSAPVSRGGGRRARRPLIPPRPRGGWSPPRRRPRS